jgi:hypothetical protein
MTKVFADLHHIDLYNSLQLLFEKRLGWELYRPIGLEWYHQNYWKIFPQADTAKQCLEYSYLVDLNQDNFDEKIPPSMRLNENYRFEEGIFYTLDGTRDRVQRAITLEKFKETEFDIIISSVPAHIPIYNKLIENFQPKAKHIFQVGNSWGRKAGVANILASTAPFNVPNDINACFYHQEFDLDIYKYEPPTEHNKVYSYIHYMKGKDQMNALAAKLPDWHFRSFGAGMEDHLTGPVKIAEQLKNSAFTFHFKPEGDGFGYTAHTTYACGRPAIIKGSHYAGKLAGELHEDGVTAIDLGKHGIDGTAKILQEMTEERHAELCENAYQRFCNVVDYDAEFQQIQRFLDNLK